MTITINLDESRTFSYEICNYYDEYDDDNNLWLHYDCINSNDEDVYIDLKMIDDSILEDFDTLSSVNVAEVSVDDMNGEITDDMFKNDKWYITVEE